MRDKVRFPAVMINLLSLFIKEAGNSVKPRLTAMLKDEHYRCLSSDATIKASHKFSNGIKLCGEGSEPP